MKQTFRKIFLLVFCALLMTLFQNCSSQQSSSSPFNMSLLPRGLHHGYQITYELLPNDTLLEVASLHEQALEFGMQVSRASADWSELETSPGVFDREALEEQLVNAIDEGTKPFVLLAAIDSEGLVVPSYLLDPTDETKLRSGLAMDSPEVISAFEGLLDWVVPLVIENGGFAIAFANEPEGYFEGTPGALSAYSRFLSAAKAKVRSIDSRLAVTSTSPASFYLESSEVSRTIGSIVDVVSLNYYCGNSGGSFKGYDTEIIRDEFQRLIANSSGKEIIFQEFGCNTGYTDEPSNLIGFSVENSQRFVQNAMSLMNEYPQFRAAFYWQMVDWSESLTQGYIDSFLGIEDLSSEFIAQFAEALETIGMLKFTDGSQKGEIWQLWLEEMRTARKD